MEPALKQRLIGATVLVALAVIFLPMLIKGPAPESGASDVPLTLPEAPQDKIETREVPLVMPGDPSANGAVGLQPAAEPDDGKLPTVDTTTAPKTQPLPAPTGGGDYAVSFGSYRTGSDADRVIAALAKEQLRGYREAVANASGQTVHRVRIGPFATQAEAEKARLQAGKVRNDVTTKVVVLNADAPLPAASTVVKPGGPVSVPTPVVEAKPVAPVKLPSNGPVKPEQPIKPVEKPKTPVATVPPAGSKPAEPKPTAKPETKPAPKPAAASVGFALQIGAFTNPAEADKLRDRARAAGFSAFVEQVRTDKGVLSRVRVGPVGSRAEADQLKAQVATKLGAAGIVRPHP